MSVTIKDVAKEAGVSVSTVSKVLNGWTTISEETASRVNEIIRQLNYHPNSRAVSFAKKSTKNIVYLTSLQKDEAYKTPHMFDILCGTYHELASQEYSMTLMDTSKDTYPGATVERIISEGSADGIIVHGTALNESVSAEILQQNFPHTIIGKPGFESQLCWIDTNHILGGEFAAQHLLSCGYKRIAFIGGKRSDTISQQRLKGVRQTVLKAGNRMRDEYIFCAESSIDAAYRAANELLSLPNPPESIVCANNIIGVGVSRALKDSGLSVPNQMAFLVFDRYPYTNIIDPSPTIIDIDMYDIGRQAGNTLARKLKNPNLLVQSFTTLPILVQGLSTEKKA